MYSKMTSIKLSVDLGLDMPQYEKLYNLYDIIFSSWQHMYTRILKLNFKLVSASQGYQELLTPNIC